MCGSDIILGIIAILFPPIPVWVKRGLCSADSLINIALCMLGVLPGILHSWYIIAKHPEPTYDEIAQRDPEQGHQRVTHYYVSQQPASRRAAPAPAAAGYGTLNSSAPNAQFPHNQQQGFIQPPPAQQAAGPSTDTPPTYQQAVDGDHKVQKK